MCGDPPVGGRISLFCRHVASSHIRCLCSFCCAKWFPIFGSKPFSGCHTESHRDPAGSQGGPSHPRGDTRFDFEGCNRSNRRCSESLFVSNFRYPQEIRGSSSNFESLGVQSVHFHSALQDGDPECDPSTAVSERLGCFNRFEGCVPSYSDSPVVQEISGFSVLGQDLPIQGPALRPQGFSLGVHKGGSHSCRSSSPVRSSSVLLSGRLASGGGLQGSFGVSSPYEPAVDSGPWVPSELGKVFPHSTETSVFYLGAHFDIPRLLARPSEHRVLALQEVIQDLTKGPLAPALFWQKFFGHLAGFVDLVPNCRLLMRPLQLHLLRYFTPLIDSQD